MNLQCVRHTTEKIANIQAHNWKHRDLTFGIVIYPTEPDQPWLFKSDSQVIVKYRRGPWAVVDQISSTTPDVATFPRLKLALVYARLHLS